MKHAYHYYAIYQTKPGEIKHMHGFFTREAQITTGEDYLELCNSIAERNQIDPEKLTLCSLSLIGTQP